MKQFEEILKLNQKELKKLLYNELLKVYSNEDILNHPKFLYAKGQIPLMLVAHLDTVHREPIKILLHDKEQNLMWSPQGIGGDDRCGVYIILSLLKKGFIPYILFTTDEEIGCIGAHEFANYIKQNDIISDKDLKYIVQLDRRGAKDSVFYRCNNEDFKKYINTFGFHEEIGSFSDISIVAPTLKVGAVNLSVGYYNEHGFKEYISIDDMLNTMNKVEQMILDINNTTHYVYRITNVDDDISTYYEQLYKRSEQLKREFNDKRKTHQFNLFDRK